MRDIVWPLSAVVLIFGISLIALRDRPDQCVQSHEETATYQRQNFIGFTSCGKDCSQPNFVYTPVTKSKWVCDRWASEGKR